MGRPFSLLTAAGTVAHHGFERRAGLGLPLEPALGRRGAEALWIAAVGTWGVAAVRGGGPRTRLALAAADGAALSTVAIHYAEWPWRWLGPLPVLVAAEGLATDQLPAYNAILLSWGAASLLSAARTRSRSEQAAAVANAALAFAPARALARHHFRWLQRDRAAA